MPLIILAVYMAAHVSERYFRVSFPMEEFMDKMKALASDYLKQTHHTQDGITWDDALENIPKTLWEKYGFYKADGEYLRQSTITSLCQDLSKSLSGLGHFHFHQLRHPYVKPTTTNFRSFLQFSLGKLKPSYLPNDFNLLPWIDVHPLDQRIHQFGA